MFTSRVTYYVSASLVRRLGADRPVKETTVIPSQDGFPGRSDGVTLLPGQRLENITHGSPVRWSEAIIR